MFPNPQGALPLPPRPSLEYYKKLAKGLAKACKSGEAEALGDWARQWTRAIEGLGGSEDISEARLDRWARDIEDFARRKLSGSEPAGGKCALTGAQFVIARSHGFESWPKFARHLEEFARKSSPVSRFEAAADAIVNGDAATLKQLLREDPELVRARSTREHGSTLLHYASANGVEDYRQKTPKNIVEMVEMLLNAGAEVDATAKVYGGGSTTLGLAATSVHPERAGVQEALLQALLDRGARLGPPPIAGDRQSIVVACVANGRSKAADFLASRGAPLDLTGAAAVGRLDVLGGFFDKDGSLNSNTAKEQLNEAFLFACRTGCHNAVEFLLQKGADPAVQSGDGQTGLHWAAIGGHLETVELLLRHQAPLEVENRYGGTVLGQTLWSAAHGADPDVSIAILEALAAAGAKMFERHTPVNATVDAWLARHGSLAEPARDWYGEKPPRQK